MILSTILLLTAFSHLAFADETCFEVSRDGKSWSKTPELLCVSQIKDAQYTLTLKTGIPGSQQEVATFHLDLLSRVKCIDCNKDTFGLANPTNSVFNTLQVKFDGKRDVKTMQETGTVKLGATVLHYRGSAGKPVTPPPAPAPAKK